jgi:hypothetical protein
MNMKNQDHSPQESLDSDEQPPPSLTKMQKLKRDLDEAVQMRETLVQKIQQNPSPELLQMFSELNEAINDGIRHLSMLSADEFRRQFGLIGEELAETIRNTDDEEFLRLGAESEPARNLRDYVAKREKFAAILHNLHPDDNPQEILAAFDAVLVEARRLMKEKRIDAEKRFPNIRKEYEMDDKYKQALAFLLETIEQRDELAETIKLAPPEKRAEGLQLLAQLDKSIEAGEQALANEYEAFQTHARAEDEMRQMLKSKSETELAELRAHLKENPGKMELVRKMLAEEFPEPKGH